MSSIDERLLQLETTFHKQDDVSKILSEDPVKWSEQVRILRGEPLSFSNRDYLLPLYRDTSKEIYIVKGRQTEGTEFTLNWLLFNLWHNPGTVGLYLSDRDSHTSKFSTLRLRDWAIRTSPVLSKLVPIGERNVSVQPFANGSVLFMHSAWNQFDQARSVPADFTVVDEIQSVDLKEIDVLRETLSHSKHGRLIGIGTGSDEGSDWHRIWSSGNQMYWDSQSNSWIPKRPESEIHSYHLPQTIVPWITAEEIEKKREKMTERRFVTEVIGWWHKGVQKPITEKDVRNLFDQNISFVHPENVDHGKGPVYLGVDWGLTNAFTVAWVWQLIDAKGPIFKVLYVGKLEEPSVEKQFLAIKYIVEKYNVTKAMLDAGAGTYQTQKLEETFADRTVKCYYMTRPQNPLNMERLDSENLITVDRTFAIDTIIDLIKRPYMKNGFAIPRIQIPAREPSKVEWLVDHFTIIEASNVNLQSGQNYPRYVHDEEEPDDALHACVYAYLAWLIQKKNMWGWISI
ncbi:MAG TPA: hypothetical protein VJ792_04210 [Candidatus Nitrosotalea sp.]|nr:hypothetical protein [Candidatus Nitrosotalea sp.]